MEKESETTRGWRRAILVADSVNGGKRTPLSSFCLLWVSPYIHNTSIYIYTHPRMGRKLNVTPTQAPQKRYEEKWLKIIAVVSSLSYMASADYWVSIRSCGVGLPLTTQTIVVEWCGAIDFYRVEKKTLWLSSLTHSKDNVQRWRKRTLKQAWIYHKWDKKLHEGWRSIDAVL